MKLRVSLMVMTFTSVKLKWTLMNSLIWKVELQGDTVKQWLVMLHQSKNALGFNCLQVWSLYVHPVPA